MAIDKSLRQHYQDGEKVDPFEKGRAIIAPKERYLPRDKKNLMDVFSDVMLRKKGLIAQDIKDVKAGKPISKVASNILKRKFTTGGEKASPFQAAWQGAKALNFGKNILGGTKGGLPSLASNVLSSPFLPIAGIAGGAMLANKYREQITGYPTQVAYEQARQGRINIDRIDMRSDPKTLENLEINLKREGLSDKEIKDRINQFKGETTRMKADVVGADIFNPNEMANLDETYENVKYNIDPSYEEPSLTGEDYDVTSDSVVNVDAVKAAIEKSKAEQQQKEKAEFDRVVAENKAKAEAEAAAQRAYAARVPDPIYHQPSGNGDRHGGGGGQTSQAAADRAGGSSYSSPFKKGGRIDKPLTGRSRDI